MKRVKLITENSNNVDVRENSNNLYIEGIFSTAEVLNANGRIYRKSTLEREINKLQEMINKRILWGELGHPSSPDINPDRIAIIVESLSWDDNNVVGRAKVIDTPLGNIAKTLIKEGNIGISSRGLGTVNEKDGYVNDDFNLLCYDLVCGPSNPGSFVRGILEGRDFTVEGSDIDKTDKSNIITAKHVYKRHIWQVLEDIYSKL